MLTMNSEESLYVFVHKLQFIGMHLENVVRQKQIDYINLHHVYPLPSLRFSAHRIKNICYLSGSPSVRIFSFQISVHGSAST